MKHALRTLVELIAPSRIRYPEVPPMELGLTPNDALETAQGVDWFAAGAAQVGPPAGLPVTDIVTAGNGGIAVARGTHVTTLRPDGHVEARALAGRVTALAGGDVGFLAAVEGHGVYELGEGSTRLFSDHAAVKHCVTALLVLSGGEVLATTGSADRGIDEWAWDLFTHRATGSLLRLSANGDVEQTRSGLPWAAGLARGPEGAVLVSLAHAHRVEKVDPHSLQPVGHLINGLPAYPWRISTAADAQSWWIAMPLVRSRFTELLLGEKEFLADMMTTVAPESWYGPSMAGGSIYREPLQLGGLRVLGQIKPWAPPRSYGLVAQVNAEGFVLRSLHSRAGGSTHGVVAAVETGGRLLVAASTRSEPVQVDPAAQEVLA